MMTPQRRFEVSYKGVVVSCSTPEDAARVARELGDSARNFESQPWLPHEFNDFVERLQVFPRKLLAFLLQQPHQEARDYDIRVAIGLFDNRALAGVLSGVSKVALSLEIAPQRIYRLVTSYSQGSPKRLYVLTPAFVKAAMDNDWPRQKDLVEEEPDDGQ